jgi:hypothetical protein
LLAKPASGVSLIKDAEDFKPATAGRTVIDAGSDVDLGGSG